MTRTTEEMLAEMEMLQEELEVKELQVNSLKYRIDTLQQEITISQIDERKTKGEHVELNMSVCPCCDRYKDLQDYGDEELCSDCINSKKRM